MNDEFALGGTARRVPDASVEPTKEPAAAGDVGRRLTRWTWLLVGVAAAVPRLLTAGRFQTVDEHLWMPRTAEFAHALVTLHPSHLAIDSPVASTMPGITTMWLGTVADALFTLGRWAHLVPADATFAISKYGVAVKSSGMYGVAYAQSVMAVATAALIGLVAWLVSRWSSPRVGIAVGVLLATEPFWVAHGAVLHTDELTALFGLGGSLALAIALDVPHGVAPARSRRWWFVGAGVLLACSPLTKLSGMAFGVSALTMIIWAIVGVLRRRPRADTRWSVVRPVLVGVGVAVVAVVVTVVVLYPALVVDPVRQWDELVRSARLGDEPRAVFLRHRTDLSAPWYFYFFVLSWRVTPWAMVALVVGIPTALVRRASRARAFAAVAIAVPTLVMLSTAAAKYDRYGLSVLGPAFVVACLALQPGSDRFAFPTRRERMAWGASGLAAVAFAASVAPWGLLYFNPLLGGGAKAQYEVPVGWYEFKAVALGAIRADVLARGESCGNTTSTGYKPTLQSWQQCGTWTWNTADAEYRVIGVTDGQRMSQRQHYLVTYGRTLVKVVKVRGIRYAEIWRRVP